MSKEPQKECDIHIAIDFGSTYTGYAYTAKHICQPKGSDPLDILEPGSGWMSNTFLHDSQTPHKEPQLVQSETPTQVDHTSSHQANHGNNNPLKLSTSPLESTNGSSPAKRGPFRYMFTPRRPSNPEPDIIKGLQESISNGSTEKSDSQGNPQTVPDDVFPKKQIDRAITLVDPSKKLSDYEELKSRVNRAKTILGKRSGSSQSLRDELNMKDITEYLEKMNADIRKMIDPDYKCPFRKPKYYLIVPPMWSDEAKDIMREAAVSAKLTKKKTAKRLYVIDEALAGFMYAESETPLKDGDRSMNAESKTPLKDGDRCMVFHVGNERVHISKLEKCTKEPEASIGKNPSNVKEISITDCDWNIEKLESKLWKMLKKNLSEKTGATPLKAAKNPNETIEVLPVNDLEELRKAASEQIQDTSDEDGAKGSTSPEERAEEQRSLSTLIDEFSFCGQNIETNGQTFTLEECLTNFITKYQKGPKYITYNELCKDVFKPVLTQLRKSINDKLTPKDEKVKAIIITGEVAKIPYFYEELSKIIKELCGIKPVSFKDMPIMKGAVKYDPSEYGFGQKVYRRTYGFLLRPFPDNNAVMEPTETNKFHVCVSRNDPILEKDIKKKMYWKSDVLPIICLCAYDKDDDPPTHPSSKDVNLVAILNTELPIDEKNADAPKILELMLTFGVENITAKIFIDQKNFTYPDVKDTSEKKEAIYPTEESTSKSNPGFFKKIFGVKSKE